MKVISLLQGSIVALIFCFFNGEVQKFLKIILTFNATVNKDLDLHVHVYTLNVYVIMVYIYFERCNQR